MAPERPVTMRSALEEALAGVMTEQTPAAPADGAGTTDEDTAAAEVTDADGETPAAPGAEGNEQTDEGAETPPSEPGTAAAEAGEADDDVPTEYFGQSLEGLPAEERRSLIAQFSERDRHIQKLLREKAESEKAGEEKSPASAEASESDDEVSDADILSALSLDPGDDSAEAKAIIALARMNLTLQAEVKGMASKDAVRETEHVWETTLTELEKTYGSLPVDRTEVYRVAATNGIAEPIDAYWRIMGPGRQEVMAEVKKRREAATAALAKDQKPAKPKSSADVKPAGLESTDTRDATVEAFNQLRKEMGWTLDDTDND